MDDFLARTAARVMGQTAAIRPRLPSLYEPVAGSFAPTAEVNTPSSHSSGTRPAPEQVALHAAATEAPAPSGPTLSPPPPAALRGVAADVPRRGAAGPMQAPLAGRREPEEATRRRPESEPPIASEAAAERLLVPIPAASVGRFEPHPGTPRAGPAPPAHRGEPPTLARQAPALAGLALPVGEARGRRAEAAPIVRVTIGRIEVRAAPAAAPPLPPRRQSGLRPLDDYLRGDRRERP